jgi:probable DNA repair protein
MEQKTEFSAKVIVAATERLARAIRTRYYAQQGQGNAAWENIKALSFNGFIAELWNQLWAPEQLVEAGLQTGVVRRIIQDSSEGGHLLNPAPAARLVQKALSIVEHYRINVHNPVFLESSEHTALLMWRKVLGNHKERHGWLTHDDAIERLISCIRDGAIALHLPSDLEMIGFLSLSPLQQDFVKALRDAGVNVTERSVEQGSPQYTLIRDGTSEEEIARVAVCIKDILLQFKSRPMDAPSIAVVVPAVEQYRQDVDRIFREHLAPHVSWPGHAHTPAPWRWIKGGALSSTPTANAALQLLRLSGRAIVSDAATSLLLNRYVGDFHAERAGRAYIDKTLRSWGGASVQFKAIAMLAEEAPGHGYAPELGRRLRELQADLAGNNSVALPSLWSERFERRLTIMGWPGVNHLSSEDYQAKESLLAILRVFASMDAVLGALPHHEAVRQITEMVDGHPFIAQCNHIIPVEIMDVWDIAGHRYDYAFVLGMTHDSLPQRAAPNPFLPYELQKAAGVPICCAEAQLARAVTLKAHISSLAPNVVVSCPAAGRDGRHLTPSLLLGNWNVETQSPTQTQEIIEATLEPCNSAFPAVTEDEVPLLRGGVRIFSAYARSPIFAALESRLRLESFPEVTDGISARMQGDIIHAAMDILWGILGDSKGLLRHVDGLDGIIRRAIEMVFEMPNIVPPYSLGKKLATMEKHRAFRIIRRWMCEIEAVRTDAFEVICREVTVEGVIGGVPVKLRIDRIDRVMTPAGERFLVLDYKTGASVYPSGWLIESLVEPQLPIYVACMDLSGIGIGRADGIGFAHLTDAECAAHIRTNWSGSLTGKGNARPVSDWDAQLDDWRAQIDANAEGFMAGQSEVDYQSVHRHKVTYGHLFGLLRIWDNSLSIAEVDQSGNVA